MPSQCEDAWSYFAAPLEGLESGEANWSKKWDEKVEKDASMSFSKRIWLHQILEVVTSEEFAHDGCDQSRSNIGLSCLTFSDAELENFRVEFHFFAMSFWMEVSRSHGFPDHPPVVDCLYKQLFQQKCHWIYNKALRERHPESDDKCVDTLLRLIQMYKQFASETNASLIELKQLGNSLEFTFATSKGDSPSEFEFDEEEPNILVVRLRLNTTFGKKKAYWNLVLHVNIFDVYALPDRIFVEPFDLSIFQKIHSENWDCAQSPYDNLLAICCDLLYSAS